MCQIWSKWHLLEYVPFRSAQGFDCGQSMESFIEVVVDRG